MRILSFATSPFSAVLTSSAMYDKSDFWSFEISSRKSFSSTPLVRQHTTPHHTLLSEWNWIFYALLGFFLHLIHSLPLDLLCFAAAAVHVSRNDSTVEMCNATTAKQERTSWEMDTNCLFNVFVFARQATHNRMFVVSYTLQSCITLPHSV